MGAMKLEGKPSVKWGQKRGDCFPLKGASRAGDAWD